jgi:hypothetical protein
MGRKPKPLFCEKQRFRQTRVRVLTAIPPMAMLLLAIWQVGLGHPWGKEPMSNGSVIGWTIFLFCFYVLLNTAKLVTEVRPGELNIRLLGRRYTIALRGVTSTRVVTFDAVRDWGGYGRRSNSRGRAYIAGGNRGVELEFTIGGVVLIGSERPDELARSLDRQLAKS